MTATRHFRLFARTEQAALLELPWALQLEDWPEDRVVDIERGIGRHVVRFVELRGGFFALKELPPPIAAREYRAARALEERAFRRSRSSASSTTARLQAARSCRRC